MSSVPSASAPAPAANSRLRQLAECQANVARAQLNLFHNGSNGGLVPAGELGQAARELRNVHQAGQPGAAPGLSPETISADDWKAADHASQMMSQAAGVVFSHLRADSEKRMNAMAPRQLKKTPLAAMTFYYQGMAELASDSQMSPVLEILDQNSRFKPFGGGVKIDPDDDVPAALIAGLTTKPRMTRDQHRAIDVNIVGMLEGKTTVAEAIDNIQLAGPKQLYDFRPHAAAVLAAQNAANASGDTSDARAARRKLKTLQRRISPDLLARHLPLTDQNYSSAANSALLAGIAVPDKRVLPEKTLDHPAIADNYTGLRYLLDPHGRGDSLNGVLNTLKEGASPRRDTPKGFKWLHRLGVPARKIGLAEDMGMSRKFCQAANQAVVDSLSGRTSLAEAARKLSMTARREIPEASKSSRLGTYALRTVGAVAGAAVVGVASLLLYNTVTIQSKFIAPEGPVTKTKRDLKEFLNGLWRQSPAPETSQTRSQGYGTPKSATTVALPDAGPTRSLNTAAVKVQKFSVKPRQVQMAKVAGTGIGLS